MHRIFVARLATKNYAYTFSIAPADGVLKLTNCDIMMVNSRTKHPHLLNFNI